MRAQQEYFVFIQEPAGQPFYVRMGEHSYSSSAGGHIILSSLRDSVYAMYIGFPRLKFPEMLFNVEVNKKDRGFELKRVSGRWQLDDLQNLQVIRPEAAKGPADSLVKKSDDYSQLMAGVVNDTAVLYGRPPQPDSVAVAAADSMAKNANNATAGSATPEPVMRNQTSPALPNKSDTTVVAPVRTASAPSVQPGGRDPRDIIRYSTENIKEGKLMIYLDRTSEVIDTIRIVIPRL